MESRMWKFAIKHFINDKSSIKTDSPFAYWLGATNIIDDKLYLKRISALLLIQYFEDQSS